MARHGRRTAHAALAHAATRSPPRAAAAERLAGPIVFEAFERAARRSGYCSGSSGSSARGADHFGHLNERRGHAAAASGRRDGRRAGRVQLVEVVGVGTGVRAAVRRARRSARARTRLVLVVRCEAAAAPAAAAAHVEAAARTLRRSDGTASGCGSASERIGRRRHAVRRERLRSERRRRRVRWRQRRWRIRV